MGHWRVATATLPPGAVTALPVPRTKIVWVLRRGRGPDHKKMSAVQNHKLFPTPKQSLMKTVLQ